MTGQLWRSYSPSRGEAGRPTPNRMVAVGMVAAANQGATAHGTLPDWCVQTTQPDWTEETR